MTPHLQAIDASRPNHWNDFVTDVVDRATDGLCFLVNWFDRMDDETPAHMIVGTYESREFDDELLGLGERLAGLLGEPIRVELMRTAWSADVPVVAMPSIPTAEPLPLARRFDDRED